MESHESVAITTLRDLVWGAFSKRYAPDDARRMTEIVVDAELCGIVSHGVIQLASESHGILAQKPLERPTITSSSIPLAATIDGHQNPGILVGALAMEEVLSRTTQHGIGIVGTHGTQSTSGHLRYYAEQIAKNDLISIVMSRSRAVVAPIGATKKVLGTNAIAYGIPAHPPLVFDASTSQISYGELLRALATDSPLPDFAAINREGDFTTDPKEAQQGALLPFGGHKGLGFSLMGEMLAGVWSGADAADLGMGDGWGGLLMAFSPELLFPPGREEFKCRVDDLTEHIRESSSPPIRLPGERSRQAREDNLKRGFVDIPQTVLATLQAFVYNE